MSKLSDLMNFIHYVCMVLSWDVVSLGSFLCSVVEGRSKVARRVSSEVRRAVFGPVLSAFGSLGRSASVKGVCRV